jgi:hypothetical protein
MALTTLRILVIAATGALIALMLYAGEPSKLWWWLLAIPFSAWIIGPAIAPYILVKLFKTRNGFVYLMIVYLALSSLWSASVYYQAFFVSTSSTSALIMVFAPLYQWSALVCVGLLGGAVISWSNRRSRLET